MSQRPSKTLVVIIGPPAVGKMTVGRELSALTGLPLFHNHLSIEAVLPVFPFGSEPFGRLVSDFRRRVFSEVAASDLPGLIFTYVWAFDRPDDIRFVNELRAIFEDANGRSVFAELWADLATRIERNAEASRLAEKASKRDVAASRRRLLEAEERYSLSSGGRFPLPNHLWLDNTELPPGEAAERIATQFDLPRIAGTRTPLPG